MGAALCNFFFVHRLVSFRSANMYMAISCCRSNVLLLLRFCLVWLQRFWLLLSVFESTVFGCSTGFNSCYCRVTGFYFISFFPTRFICLPFWSCSKQCISLMCDTIHVSHCENETISLLFRHLFTLFVTRCIQWRQHYCISDFGEIFWNDLHTEATVQSNHIDCKLRGKNYHRSTNEFFANITLFDYIPFANKKEMVLMLLLSHRTQCLIRKIYIK